MPQAVLDQNIYGLSAFGPVAATIQQPPLRQSTVRYGDGLDIWEGTTNLLPNPSFAVNLNGYAGVNGATIAPVAAPCFVGSGAVAMTMAAGAGGTIGMAHNIVAGELANSTVYTFSVWVYVPTGQSTLQLSVQGAILGTGGFSSTTTVFDKWVRITCQFTSSAAAATSPGTLYLLNGATAIAGQVVYTDAWQLEAKPYATPFCDGSLGAGHAWTGVANASTSTRSAAQNVWPTPSTIRPVGMGLTIAAWLRVGVASSALGKYIVALNPGGTQPALFYDATSVGFSSNVDVSGSVVTTLAPGDLVFVAGTLASDGKTFTVYVSKNGGALQTSTSAASATAYTGVTQVAAGTLTGGGGQVDGALEQILLLNGALTSGEIAVLAGLTDEFSYASDPRVVLAAATGSVRGGTFAETAAGTGMLRADRVVKGRVEPIVRTTNNPDDDTAAIKVSVPAGTGFGQGQQIGIGYPAASFAYPVQRVYSPGGEYDEIYV
jgi:hypothetical protein